MTGRIGAFIHVRRTILHRWQPTGGLIDAATVTTAWNLPGMAQAAKTAMSPPSLIPVITTRAGSAHSVAANCVTSADRNDTSPLPVVPERFQDLAEPAA